MKPKRPRIEWNDLTPSERHLIVLYRDATPWRRFLLRTAGRVLAFKARAEQWWQQVRK